jgi:hypothetical protein
MRKDDYQIHHIDWQGITIEIRWNHEHVIFDDNLTMAHLEIETISPARSPLPMTETGYRSHFTHDVAVYAYGDPVSFVEAWLAETAATPAWQLSQSQRQQLSLF